MSKLLLSVLASSVLGIPLLFSGFSKQPFTPISETKNTTIIDGKSNPEKIPEHEAYTILFRLVARRETDGDKNSARFYLKGALGCSDCNEQDNRKRTKAAEDADINAVIAAAEEFDRRVSVLDQRAMSVLDRYHPEHPPLSLEDKEELKRLQKQKESIAIEVANALQQQLSKEGLKNLRQHIKERVKPKMKMFLKKESVVN